MTLPEDVRVVGSVERAIGWWRAVVERSTDVLVAMGRDGKINYMSPAGMLVFGWLPETLLGTDGFDHIHPDDVDRLRDVLSRGLDGQPTAPYPTFRIRHSDGRWRHVEARASNLLAVEEVSAFIISLRDVTTRVEAEAAVLLRDQSYRNVIEATPEPIIIHQHDVVVHANPAAVKLFDATKRSDLVGRRPGELFSHDATTVLLNSDDPSHDNFHQPSSISLHATTADRLLNRLDGKVVPVEVTSIPTIWDGMPATQVVARDVTERKEADLTLIHLATHDPLTGLPNRSLLNDRLHHATARAIRTRRPFAVLFLDLDRFKEINDTLGHEVGDEVLRQVANRLVDAVRPGDTVARLGGDEFVVVVEDLLVTDTIELVVERVQSSFDPPFPVAGRDLRVGVSLGVLVTSEGGDPRALLRDADTAMYTAKTQGRGRAVRFDAALREQVHRHEDLERRLRAAVDEDQIRAALQPVVRLPDRRVVGAEALMRWEHPKRGQLAPEAFLDVAEESGVLPALGDLLLVEACRQMSSWRGRVGSSYEQAEPWLSINLSRGQMKDPGFASRILATLAEHQLLARSLYIEVTEDVVLDDPVGTIDALRPLRDAGVGLVVDDFGCGYTSLTALRRLSPDLLKIDRTFIAGMTDSPSDAAMVRAVIQMGHALGIPVLAEGVELVEQQHLLAVLGCDMAQGHLFARPGDEDAMARLLG